MSTLKSLLPNLHPELQSNFPIWSDSTDGKFFLNSTYSLLSWIKILMREIRPVLGNGKVPTRSVLFFGK